MSVDDTPKPHLEGFTGQRLTYTTSKSFDDVLKSIRSSVNVGHSFQSAVEKSLEVGEPLYGLFLIAELNHGKWYKLFNPNASRIHKFIMGNPFALKNIMEHDLAAGLHGPLDFLIVENLGSEGNPTGTSIIYDLPSSIMASYEGGEALDEESRKSDKKVKETVVKWLGILLKIEKR